MNDTKMNIVSGLVILAGVFTILLGWLKLIDWTYGGTEVIIVAAIGLIGAIIGGVISGSLTLAGVYLSISHNRKEKMIERYPIRKRSADKVGMWVEDVKSVMHFIKDGEVQEKSIISYDYILKELKEIEEKEELILDFSMKVDGYFFSRISEILVNCVHIRLTLMVTQTSDDLATIIYAHSEVKKMVADIERMIKEIEVHVDKMSKSVY